MNFETAKQQLCLQKDVREKKPQILGNYNENFDDLLEKSIELTEQMRKTKEGIANEKAILERSGELGIKEEQIKNAFETGLRYNIKATCRINLLNKDSSNEDIQDVVGAYTLSFRSALNAFKRNQKKDTAETVKTILEIVEKMYTLSPNILNELRKEYRDNHDVEDWMIKHFVVGDPTGPKEAIERALVKIKELREKYKDNPDVDDWMIKRSVVSNSRNPEKAIAKALIRMNKLKNKHKDNPNVKEWMIARAATFNQSEQQEDFIEKEIKKKKKIYPLKQPAEDISMEEKVAYSN